jgi:hypothetical protein
MRINDEQQKTPPRPPFPFSEFPCPSFSSALATKDAYRQPDYRQPALPISEFQFFSVSAHRPPDYRQPALQFQLSAFPISAFAPHSHPISAFSSIPPSPVFFGIFGIFGG